MLVRRGRRAYVTDSPEVPPLDGEVTSAAEIISTAENPANAGNSYWMRGGDYTAMTLDGDARPATEITFTTYPGEQVRFTGEVRFEGSANLVFDGNADNMTRAPAGGYPDGDYGLWFWGPGVTGYEIPDVDQCMTFSDSGADKAENITIRHFRLGDAMSTDENDWRAQHGIVFVPGVHDITFEDFELGYIGLDLFDQIPANQGDQASGGFGLYFITLGSTDFGDFTFTRGHFHHTMNDIIQYGPAGADPARCRFDTCMFEELENFGDAHCDFLQIFGGAERLEVEDCVWRNGTEFLFHGDVPGEPRVFTNCLIGDTTEASPNVNKVPFGKSNEGGIAAQFVFINCTLDSMNGMPVEASSSGFTQTPRSQMRNCIHQGFGSESGVDPDNVFSNVSEPNIVTGGGLGLDGDTAAASVTYNSDGEATGAHAGFGWAMPVGFPWSL